MSGNDDLEKTVAVVERVLGHRFADPDLLRQGLTHTSAIDPNLPAEDRRERANERMEFLGDTFLGAAVALELYRAYPDETEGALAKAKSQLVSRETLARCMERLDLLRHCRIGDNMPDPAPDSVKANLAEGILGAIFLDGGWDAVRAAVVAMLGQRLRADLEDLRLDAKSRLQERCLERYQVLPAYASERSGGSDHAPEFTCTVTVADLSATASGTSRRRSEAAAAAHLLALLEESQDSRRGAGTQG